MPKVSNERTLLGALDALVEKYHLLKHPFYRAWTEGTLSKKALALYAEQYYQHVQAFPENLRDLASRSNGDAELKALVLENLAEELDETASHPQLWRQFAASVGVSDVSLERAEPLPGIAALLRARDGRASNPAATGRAPSHPAADRETHRHRSTDRSPSAPRPGKRAFGRAASCSPGCRAHGPVSSPGWCL